MMKFKADRNQLIAIAAMLAAIFTFAAGEILIGCILFAISAVFSIGGLFWNAHAQDKIEAADAAASVRNSAPNSLRNSAPNSERNSGQPPTHGE